MTAKNGNHRIDIDWEEFEKLCEIQCSKEEVAFWFRCSEDTIDLRVKEHYNETFSVIKLQKAVRGKVAIRRGLFSLGLKGNLGALIWLSKNHLGFSEKIENKQDPDDKKKDLEIAKLTRLMLEAKAIELNDPVKS